MLHGGRLRFDSRAVETGDVFVATARSAESVDACVRDALTRGASAVLVDDRGAGSGDRVYPVADLATVLGVLADDFTGEPSADVSLVGVTGTNGKTSAVQLLSQAWHELGVPGASIGTLGAGTYGDVRVTSGLTTPPVTEFHELLAEFRDAGATAVAVEVSSHALAQGRVAAARFDIVAFTNLSRDHLDYHGTMEGYAAEKAKIFALDGVETAVVNLDDDHVRTAVVPEGVRRIGVSSRGAADAAVSAHDVRLDVDGLRFTLGIAGERHPISTALMGRFNVDNLLVCAAVLHAQGVQAARIAEVLGRLQPVVGRMNRLRLGADSPLVVIDYAHTPDALAQSLTALAEHDHRRIVTVFGCTGDRDRGKRPEMARIAEQLSDAVIVTDDDVHHEDGDAIVAEIVAGFARPASVRVCRDRSSAIELAIAQAGPSDAVLIAGKGHEAWQVVGDERVPFSDSATAHRALRARAVATVG